MSRDTFNRTLDFNAKAKYFIASWLLIEVVLIDAVGKFLLILKNKKIIHLDNGFDPTQIIWGDKLFWNIVKLIIVCVFAYIFGIGYTYLARKVRENDKAIISLINSVIAVFGWFIIIYAVVWLFNRSEAHDSLLYVTQAIKENHFYSLLIVLQLVGAGSFTYLGLIQGQKMTMHIEEDEKGRMLGIKWYHYLWLWPAISIYAQALLFFVYISLHMIRVALSHFHWWDIFGATAGDTSSNSVESLAGAFIFLYLMAAIVFAMIKYQRDILSGDKKVNLFTKILSSIAVAGVIPLLLVMYTAIGNSSV